MHDPNHRIEVLFTIETTLEAVLNEAKADGDPAAVPADWRELTHSDTAHYAVQWLNEQLRDAFEGTACCPWPEVLDGDFPDCTAPRVTPTKSTKDACEKLVRGDPVTHQIDLSTVSPFGQVIQDVADGTIVLDENDPVLELSETKRTKVKALKVLNARSPEVGEETLFGVRVSTLFVDAPQSESPSASPSLSPSLSPSFSPTESTLEPTVGTGNVTNATIALNDALNAAASTAVVLSVTTTLVTSAATTVITTAITTEVFATGATTAVSSTATSVAASSAASTAAAGPAVISMMGVMQTFHMYGKASALVSDGPSEAGNIIHLTEGFSWTNLQDKAPWLPALVTDAADVHFPCGSVDKETGLGGTCLGTGTCCSRTAKTAHEANPEKDTRGNEAACCEHVQAVCCADGSCCPFGQICCHDGTCCPKGTVCSNLLFDGNTTTTFGDSCLLEIEVTNNTLPTPAPTYFLNVSNLTSSPSGSPTSAPTLPTFGPTLEPTSSPSASPTWSPTAEVTSSAPIFVLAVLATGAVLLLVIWLWPAKAAAPTPLRPMASQRNLLSMLTKHKANVRETAAEEDPTKEEENKKCALPRISKLTRLSLLRFVAIGTVFVVVMVLAFTSGNADTITGPQGLNVGGGGGEGGAGSGRLRHLRRLQAQRLLAVTYRNYSLEKATSPAYYLIEHLSGEERAFIGNLFWVATFTLLILFVHIPAQYYASGVASNQKRDRRREKMLKGRLELHRNLRNVAKEGKPKGGPVSKWEKFGNTYPRLELYAFFLAYQGLAQSSAAAISAPSTSAEARACAGFVFMCFSFGGLGYMSYFVHKKVITHPHARMIRDEHGFHRWVDRDPKHKEHGNKHEFYSGFCDRYGAFFEDYKNKPACLYCMVFVLLHRLLIGVFIGAMASRADPEDLKTRRLQTAMLVAVSICFLLYIICIRPYHVPIARQDSAEHFFRSNALPCTATARSLIPAECSAVS